MARHNHVAITGRIVADPKFETLKANNTPCLRFNVAIPRDASQMSQRKDESGRKQRVDIIRVCEYGARAKTDYFYLKKDTVVVILGWVEQRPYYDKDTRRRKYAIDINAETILPSFGADFARGDRQLEMRTEEAESHGMTTAEMELAGLTFAALPPDAELDISEE